MTAAKRPVDCHRTAKLFGKPSTFIVPAPVDRCQRPLRRNLFFFLPYLCFFSPFFFFFLFRSNILYLRVLWPRALNNRKDKARHYASQWFPEINLPKNSCCRHFIFIPRSILQKLYLFYVDTIKGKRIGFVLPAFRSLCAILLRRSNERAEKRWNDLT